MKLDKNDYINNGIFHDIVDQLIINPNLSYQVSFDEHGRKWTFENNSYDINDILASQRGIISQLFTRVYVEIRLLFSSDFREKFDFAISKINVEYKNGKKFAKNILKTKEVHIQETIDQLIHLRSNQEDVKRELEELNMRLTDIKEPVNALEAKIANLNQVLKTDIILKLEELVKQRDAKLKDVERLKQIHEEAKLYIEDKKKSTFKSIHLGTILKNVEELAEEKLIALHNLGEAERKLSKIVKQMNAELSSCHLEYAVDFLIEGNCSKFFEDKVMDLEKEKSEEQENCDRETALVKLEIQTKEEALLKLKEQCREKELEVTALNGKVPSANIEMESHDELASIINDNNANSGSDQERVIRTNELESVVNNNNVPFAQETPEGSSNPPLDISTKLIKTGFENIDKTVEEIFAKTGSMALANVWARLLGKFGKKFGHDIVKSIKVNGQEITINLVPVEKRKADEQYKIWVPTSRNAQGVPETVGGVVIMLGAKIVLNASQRSLGVKQGFQNFVRVPQWVPKAFGEFNSANTTVINEDGNQNIGITAEKKVLLIPIRKEVVTPHARLDRNWRELGEVITDDKSNLQIIKDHDHNYISNY